MVKYSKYNDHRGGGRFSGRLTATHVMAGAIARKLLSQALKVKTTSFVTQIGKIKIFAHPAGRSILRIHAARMQRHHR